MPGLSTLVAARRSAWAVVAATSAVVVALAVVALRGTRWSFGAIHSDSAFRTEAVTRYADSGALADYAYRGLPAYYPPAWPWVQGRVAALFDVPGWTVMKPAVLVLAVLVPVAAFLLWRRVLPDAAAAAVVAATTLVAVDLQKPDEWLVLAVLVPWWLEVVRGVRAEGRQPWPRWAYGLVLGGLLLTHTFYFLPLAVATVLGWLVDLLRRRRPALGVVDALVIGGVGLVVAAPYWLPMLVTRLQAPGSDNLQMRWNPRGFDVPPIPLPQDWVGVLGLLGVVWLALHFRSRGVAEGLGLALLAGYTVALGGQWLQRFEVALLPFKSFELIESCFVATGVVAAVDLARRLRELEPRGRLARAGTWALRGCAVAALVVIAVLGVRSMAEELLDGRDTRAALDIRYPDGSYPTGGDGADSSEEFAFTGRPEDPPANEVRDAWRELAGSESYSEHVIITDRVDLLATTPVHPFTTWKSIYSHPNGQYEARVAFLQELADCPTPGCAADMLRSNPYDRVQGVIAVREEEHLLLRLGVDNYPEGWSFLEVRLPLRLFEAPFRRRDVGTITVVALR